MKKNSFYYKNGVRLVSLLFISSSLSLLPSCSNSDDDLRTSIDQLDDRLTALENAVASMKTQIESVKTITDVLNSKGFVESVTEDANGNILVKFSNGKETLINKGDTSAPLITVKEEDGVFYWAKDLNGTVEFLLDGNNNKMPVSGITPQIRINAITKEWETSVDNGKTWQSTGVVAAIDNGTISAFESIEEDDNYVYFNFVSGAQIKIAKTKEFSMVLVGGPQYFAEGETKVVKVVMKGVFKYSLSKPDGWKVAVTTDGLSITAPAEENPYAEKSGVVAITSVSADGKSIIAEVKVNIGEAPFSIVINEDKIQISSNQQGRSYYAGVCEASKFTEAYIEELLSESMYDYIQYYPYDGEIAGLTSCEIVPGVDYLVWAIGNKGFSEPDMETITTASYYVEPIRTVGVELISVTSANASFKVSMNNCDQYYIGAVQGLDIEGIMELVSDTYLSKSFINNMSEVKLSDLNNDWGSPVKCTPSTSYTVWAAPFKTGEYTKEDFVLTEVTLLDPDFTGTADVLIDDVTVDFTKYTATLTPGPGAVGFYYSHMTEGELLEYASDADLVKNLVRNAPYSDSEYVYTQSWLNAATTYYLLAVAVDSDGKIGPLVKKQIITRSLEFNGTASATCVGTPLKTSASFKVTPSGNVKEYKYLNCKKGQYPYGVSNDLELKNYIALNEYNPVVKVRPEDLVDNTIEVSRLDMDTDYDFYMLVMDENGNPSVDIIKIEYTTEFYSIIRNNKPEYKESSVSVISADYQGYGNYTLKYSVALPEGCQEAYVIALDEGTYSTFPTAAFKDILKYTIKNGALYKGDELNEISKYISLPAYVCVVAVIDDKTIYQTYAQRIEKPEEEVDPGTPGDPSPKSAD